MERQCPSEPAGRPTLAAEHKVPFERQTVTSGLEPLDALLGGGLARGTSTLVIGPTGVGKTTVATQYALEAAAQGAHAAVYPFDETVATFQARSEGLGMKVGPRLESGRLKVRQVDPAELSPGEFAPDVCRTVEREKSRIVVIDSLNGYLNAMPSERYLTLHLHELLTFLGQQGVTTLVVMAQHGLVGCDTQAPVDASYLADAVLLRYFEAAGEVRRAISVIKKRTGRHEPTIRELRLEDGKGISVGEPVREFQGVLSGSPVFVGEGFDRAR